MRRGLLPLFFLSGVSGLIYEVIWVRQFGNVFGNTIDSAALVTAVFMCGLGLGAFVAGRWADRGYGADPLWPLAMYARVELGIGALGFLVSLLLPRLESVAAWASSYDTIEHGWHALSLGSHLAQYLVATVLLLPITTLMGATLTLLIRALVATEISAAGYRVGLLYGVNTLGAAIGCLSTDLLLIPAWGLWTAQLLAVALNVIVGLGALLLLGETPTVPKPNPPPAGSAEASSSGLPVRFAALAIFISGFAGMGMEMVWFRQVTVALGSFRLVFSLLLTVILLGVVLGSLLGGFIQQRTQRAVELYLAVQALFVLTALGSLWAYSRVSVVHQLKPFRESFLAAPPSLQLLWQVGLHLRAIAEMVGVPALLMGFSFPLANACVQSAVGAVGRRAGALYLSNTLGAVLGSLVTGFLLLPALGLTRSAGALGVVALLGLIPLVLLSRDRSSARRVFLSSSIAVALALLGWFRLEPEYLLKKDIAPRLPPKAHILSVREAATEVITVIELPAQTALYTNGHPMSSTHLMAQRYMRAFSHLPLLMSRDPERVLVICFGVGNTLHAASLHPSIKSLEVVDLSKNVLDHADYFALANHHVLEDPRTAVFINDGRHHLRMSELGRYDLITLEPPPVVQAGVSSLYSTEFYRLARERLRPGGFMTQWLPASQVAAGTTRSMVRAFIEVFPKSVLLSGTGSELILLGTTGEIALDPDRVRAALERAPAVKADLERISLSRLTEIAGSFVADQETMAAATADAAPISDDHPTLEYVAVSNVLNNTLPADLFAPARLPSWCPKCAGTASTAAELADLPAYMAVLTAYYQSPWFLSAKTLDPPKGGRGLPKELSETVRASAYLSGLFAPAGQ